MNKLSLKWSVGCFTVALILSSCGCAAVRGRGTQAGEYAIPEITADIEVESKLVRDVVRDVLRESPVEIYTRDKRGRFVAFADMGRAFLTPRRLRLVIRLKPVSESKTHLTIQTFPEAYTVQLLTNPAWRPAAFGDNSLAKDILDSIKKRTEKIRE